MVRSCVRVSVYAVLGSVCRIMCCWFAPIGLILIHWNCMLTLYIYPTDEINELYCSTPLFTTTPTNQSTVVEIN